MIATTVDDCGVVGAYLESFDKHGPIEFELFHGQLFDYVKQEPSRTNAVLTE